MSAILIAACSNLFRLSTSDPLMGEEFSAAKSVSENFSNVSKCKLVYRFETVLIFTELKPLPVHAATSFIYKI